MPQPNPQTYLIPAPAQQARISIPQANPLMAEPRPVVHPLMDPNAEAIHRHFGIQLRPLD